MIWVQVAVHCRVGDKVGAVHTHPLSRGVTAKGQFHARCVEVLRLELELIHVLNHIPAFSISFVSDSGRTRWPQYFEAQPACFPFNPWW
jgi:hypothetical protein